MDSSMARGKREWREEPPNLLPQLITYAVSEEMLWKTHATSFALIRRTASFQWINILDFNTCTVEVISKRPKERRIPRVEAAVHTLFFPADNINDTGKLSTLQRKPFKYNLKGRRREEDELEDKEQVQTWKFTVNWEHVRARRSYWGWSLAGTFPAMENWCAPWHLLPLYKPLFLLAADQNSLFQVFPLAQPVPCFQFPFCKAFLFSFLSTTSHLNASY